MTGKIPDLDGELVTKAAKTYAESAIPQAMTEEITRDMAVRHLERAFTDGASAMAGWVRHAFPEPADTWLDSSAADEVRRYISEEVSRYDEHLVERLFREAFNSGRDSKA
jgi:hypothetical protein